MAHLASYRATLRIGGLILDADTRPRSHVTSKRPEARGETQGQDTQHNVPFLRNLCPAFSRNLLTLDNTTIQYNKVLVSISLHDLPRLEVTTVHTLAPRWGSIEVIRRGDHLGQVLGGHDLP